jgi:hypothetical protein
MPNVVVRKLHSNLHNLDYTRLRMEALFRDGRIALRDLHSVYEALFLRAVTSFETFLEELFVSILERKVRYRGRGVARRMTADSRETMMKILLQGKSYLDWLPFDRTENRANLYLTDGKPFTDLTKDDKVIINRVVVIRHAIAHSSAHSKKQFETQVVGNLFLLAREKLPAAFLRSQANPAQNRFEIYVGELGRIAGFLC